MMFGGASTLETADQYDSDPYDLPPAGPAAFAAFDWNELYKWMPGLTLQRNPVTGKDELCGRKSDIAQAVLHHLGKPLRLDNHAFMLPIYNSDDKNIVMKCSRQVSKTTSIATLQVIESVIYPYWRSLYVSPSALQTRQYSNEKLRPTIYDSPFIAKHFIDKTVIDQVFEKTLTTGSYMFLRYAFLTPARARGIPASRVFFDEAQDLLKDNIKIIGQSTSASLLATGQAGASLLAGTPLTFSNTLEEYWRWSTQNEWLVPCECVKPRFWNMLGIENIGPTGLVCSKCSKKLNPAKGQWVSFAPGELYKGYHITQLQVPWKQGEEAWATEIVMPMQKWPEAKFHNEILGLSFDSASAPITRFDIERCCYPSKQHGRHQSAKFAKQKTLDMAGLRIFGGVDWGEGRSEGGVEGGRKRFASFTVLTLGAYVNPELFWMFFMKRYTGKDVDPEIILPDVLNVCGQFNVELLGVDWGHGWGVNSRLFAQRGRERVVQFNYSSSLHERKRWDQEAFKFVVNRNAVMSQFFLDIKQERMMFPTWEELEPFGRDILAEYVEYNDRTRTMQYDHPIDQPDDALHSGIYCKLAADIAMGRF